jgi:hypothetical protein
MSKIKTLRFVAEASHNSNDDVWTESGQPASPETRPTGPARLEYRPDELLPWVVFGRNGQQAAAFSESTQAFRFLLTVVS